MKPPHLNFLLEVLGFLTAKTPKTLRKRREKFSREGVDNACRLRYIGIVGKCADI